MFRFAIRWPFSTMGSDAIRASNVAGLGPSLGVSRPARSRGSSAAPALSTSVMLGGAIGYGLSVRNAAGTGILLLLVTVAVGTFEQALHGFVSLKLAMAILIGSSIGSQLGALTTYVLPNRVLRLIFAVLVGATAAMIAWDLLHLLKFA